MQRTNSFISRQKGPSCSATMAPPAQRGKRRRSKRGQALVEYVLLVAFVTLIFGSVFSIIRRVVYFFWICELYPRVASVASCDSGEQCLALLQTGQNEELTPPACEY